MKNSRHLVMVMLLALSLLSTNLYAQEQQTPPKFLTVTTMHWNMDMEDFSMDDWKAVEKEFSEKVTKKNELIMGFNVALHYMTADNTELVFVQAFKSWEDIGDFGKRNGDLIKEGWPDEAKREAFFKKRSAYYDDRHSDEIYAILPGAKPRTTDLDKEVLYYVRKSHLAFPDDGEEKEFMDLFDQYAKAVTHQNKFLKGYYPYAHAWGADKRDFIEVFVIDSLADLENALDEQGRLFKEAWSDETKRKAYNKNMGKYFTGFHADYVYRSVPELSK